MKKVKYEEGVSDVIGTILILAITVVLFSTVFLYLQQLPSAPSSEQVTIYQEISFNPSSHAFYENLTEKTGSILARSSSYLMVLINNVEHTKAISQLQVTTPYGNASGNIEPGDTVHWSSVSQGISVPDNSIIHSILFYRQTNQILWQTQNNLSDVLSITEAYYSPSPLVSNSPFTVTVQVYTLDVADTQVHLNITSLNGSYFNQSMSLYAVSGNLANYFYSVTTSPEIARSSTAVIYARMASVSETENIYLG